MIIKNVEESITDETLNRLREMLQIRREMLETGLKTYIKIQKCAENGGPINDDFKKNYTIFYKMNSRRPDETFKDLYFSILDILIRDNPLPDNTKDVFKHTISKLYEFGIRSNKATGERDHASEICFTSKLLHTVDPNLPIWDGIVAKDHFRWKHKTPEAKTVEDAAKEAAELCWDAYSSYKKAFTDYVNCHSRGQRLIELFNESCGDTHIIDAVTDVKKVDFILWLDRDEKMRKSKK